MIHLTISSQPTDETCGPTCLHAVYQYYGLNLSLESTISGVKRSLSGGTLAALLGKHALEQGFKTTIYTNNLNVFDPTWFEPNGNCREGILEKLATQSNYKTDKSLLDASQAYGEYIQSGGTIYFKTIRVQLLKEYFNQNIPILTSLSATYLYSCARERFTQEGVSIYDDIQGTPCGHFVVLCGYDAKKKHVIIADPHRENPLAHGNYYKVNIGRLINAIMLGVLTQDGNILIVEPKRT